MPDDEETLQGTVDRVIHRGEDGFVVTSVLVEELLAPVRAVGTIPGAEPGAVMRLQGRWDDHPRFGRQFRVRWATPVRPETAGAMERFLASGLVEGIGPVMARRLVEAFGTDTLEVIDKHPERLREVDGIGPGRAAKVVDAWREQQGAREALFFLQGHGVGSAHAARILEELGDRAVPLVRDNPYLLAERIRGIGFHTADRIARNLGFDPAHPARAEAAMLHLLDAASEEGHCALPRDELLSQTEALLTGHGEPSPADLDAALVRLGLGGRAVEEEADGAACWVWPAGLYDAERHVAATLRALAAAPPDPGRPDTAGASPSGAVRFAEELLGIRLATGQKEAVAATLEGRLVVITGGPGTGKTTVVRSVLQVHQGAGRRVLLAAPTGRAAHRLAEATDDRASTLHRALEFSPRDGRFQRNEHHPLDADLVVVDEASMVDLPLMRRLVDALRPGTTLVLVGDADQLPSVGPGNVLADVIASGAARVVRLTEVFRQAGGSRIVDNAHRLLRGEPPVLPARGEARAEFYFFERDEPEDVLQTVVRLCAERIPRGFGLHPLDDVQVLAPMHKAVVGVASLNEALQAALNPHGAEWVRGGQVLREGDKVMQVRNDYDLDVFNGDIGRIRVVNPEQRRLHVALEGRTVVYEGSQADSLRPAYAVSIHKSQGSEYPAVVVPLHTQHWIMLRRDLLYTAVTRGKRLVVLVGSRRALRRAVDNAETAHRHTRLAERLRGGGCPRRL